MVTLIKYGALSGGEKYNVNVLSIDGLSTDTKPTVTYIEYGSDGREVGRMGIPNGSLYTEIDTGDTYMYDVDNTTWHKVSIGGGGGGSGFAPTQEQLDAMNSGIDSEKVEQIETNKTNILSKANIFEVNTATANLQAQINNIITPVTQDAEVQNARIGDGGTAYPSLKQRLDAEYNYQLIDTSQLQAGYVHFPETSFRHGNIAMDGSIDTSYTSRVVMESISIASTALVLTIASGKAVVYATYTAGGEKETRTAGITETLTIPANTRYRICIYPSSGESLLNVANIGEYVRTVTYNSTMANKIANLESDGSVTTSRIATKAVTPIKTSFIIHKDGTNFIPQQWIENTYIRNGIETSYEGWYSTTPVYLQPNTEYYWSNLYGGYYAFYSEDGTVIESHGINDPPANPFTIPSGAAYARFTAVTEEQKLAAWVSTNNTTPQPYALVLSGVEANYSNNPCDFNEYYISAFNTCICIGDSLTYGVFNHNESGTTEYTSDTTKSYPAKLQKMTGIACTNEGLASATFDEWYAQKASVLTSGYDMAIIQLGVNDRFRYERWTQAAETALTNIISDLQAANEGIKIFVATIIPALGFTGEVFDEISQGIRDTVEVINDTNVILLDMAVYGHTADNQGYNVGHLSELGYTRLAMDYRNYISWVMAQNMVAFRNIQNIGTDYYYS